MELIIEKVISSAGMPLSPGDCMRRVMEGVASGILINGPGILDPCEKDPHDAIKNLTKQQREDLTVSAQQFLRFIAFRQIHKVRGELSGFKILFLIIFFLKKKGFGNGSLTTIQISIQTMEI